MRHRYAVNVSTDGDPSSKLRFYTHQGLRGSGRPARKPKLDTGFRAGYHLTCAVAPDVARDERTGWPMRNLTVTAIYAAALTLTALTASAQAYIDLGTGSYLLQLLIAGVLGGLFAIKLYWTKLKAFVYSRFSKSKDGDKECQ